jgi:hypothetical protein
MKSAFLSSIFKIIYFLVLIKSKNDDEIKETCPNASDLNPCFSFNKDDFSEFEFTFTDDQVNDESLMKPPFGRRTPLGNFFETFTLFYQHAKIKNDEEFKGKLSKFFDSCHEKDEECKYEHVNFDLYFEHQLEEIKEIMDEKDTSKQRILIKEQDGKVVCTPNNDFVNTQDDDITENLISENEFKNNMINFFTKFNEMYLQGSLGVDYNGSLNKFFDEYVEKVANPPFDADNPHAELLTLCLEIDKTLRFNNKELTDESEEKLLNNCKEEILSFFKKYTSLIISRHFKSNIPDSIVNIIPKVAAKVLYNISGNQDIFSLQSSEYNESVTALTEHLKKFFEGKNLSEKSIEHLVILCLEWDV